ncbi:MAG: DUF5615 family PIN-like protein [candidate division WOR-3 bacterium]
MKFKLDENFGTRTQRLFQDAGHDIQTVRAQGLQGCLDQELYNICCSEERCLVTLDLDFADVTRFPPNQTKGIVVIRLPLHSSLSLLEQLVSQFLQALNQMTPDGKLWVIELGRIRIHESYEDNE